MKKGDYIPEVYFIGQIVGGQDFNAVDEGIFVEASLKHGEHWQLLEDDPLCGPIQTHTAYADEEGYLVFAHPFEYHFRCKSAAGWPKLSLKVWRIDELGNADNIAYGVGTLPN